MVTINYRPSAAHWIFPPIIIGVLVILLVVLGVRRGLRCRKEKIPFFSFSNKAFLAEHWDKARLLGTLVLLALYIVAMQYMGFLLASIVFVFLYNILYNGIPGIGRSQVAGSTGGVLWRPAIRSILVSLINSVVSSVLIWLLFSRIFKITLP